jgi:hypothetical protein
MFLYDKNRPEGDRWYEEPVAQTSGQQDHSNPWVFAGEDTIPPENP